MEQESEKEIQQKPDNRKDEEIDLIEILRRIIAVRKTIYKAAGVGMVMGIIIAISIPKQYTVKVTLSPEMGNSKGSSGLAGLAASFLGRGIAPCNNIDTRKVSAFSRRQIPSFFAARMPQKKKIMDY